MAAALALGVSLLGAVVVASSPASAQTSPWAFDSSLPQEYGFTAVSCAAGTSDCAALGTSGAAATTTLWSTDSGASWQSSALSGGYLNDLSCYSSSDCVAAGSSSGQPAIFSSTDGGESWSPESGLPSPNSGGASMEAVSCVAVSGSLCVAVDNTGDVYTSSDGGNTWTEQTNSFSSASEAVLSCWSSSDCAILLDRSQLEVTIDAGADWVLQSLPASESGANLSGLSCTSSGTCLVIGATSSANVALSGAGFSSNAGAGTWSDISSDLPTIALFDASQGFAPVSCDPAGDFCAAFSASALIATTNLGKSWSPATDSIATPASYGASCSSSADCVSVGTGPTAGNAVMQTTDGGSTWTRSTALPETVGGSHGIQGLSCVSVSTCSMLASGTETDGSAGEVALQSTDGGTSWSFVALPSDFVSSVAADGAEGTVDELSCVVGGTVCVAVDNGSATAPGGDSSGFYFLYSSNSGASWSDVVVGSTGANGSAGGSAYADLSCPTDTFCMATLNGVIFASTDGGQTWDMTAGQPLSASVVSCWAADDCMVASDGVQHLTGLTPAMWSVTTDGGATWSTASSSISVLQNVVALDCPSSTNCVAEGNPPSTSGSLEGGSSVLAASTDSGNTWSIVAADENEELAYDNPGLSCWSTTQCMATGYDGTGIAAELTGDGGAAWEFTSTATLDLTGAGAGVVDCPASGTCIAANTNPEDSGPPPVVYTYSTTEQPPSETPTGLSASLDQYGDLSASWNAVSDPSVTNYVVEAVDETTGNLIGSMTVPSSSTTAQFPGTVTEIPPDETTDTFSVTIAAANDAGTGPISAPFTLGTAPSGQAGMTGEVTDTSGNPISGAPVQICETSSSAQCDVVQTSPEGTWSVGDLSDGAYQVIASSPGTSDYLQSAPVSVTLTGTTTVMLPTIELSSPPDLQSLGGTITWSDGTTETSGTPSFQWSEASQVSIADTSCPVSVCTLTSLTAQGYTDINTPNSQEEPLTENLPVTNSTESRTYSAPDASGNITSQDTLNFNVPPLAPMHGAVNLSYQLEPVLDVPTNFVDFGTVTDGTPEQQSVLIQNVSNTTQDITANVFGDGLSGGGDYQIAPGSSAQIPVVADASGSNTFSGEVNIFNGDLQVSVPVAGEGSPTPPYYSIQIEGNEDYGDVPPGGNVTHIFTCKEVSSTGNESSCTAPGWSLYPDSGQEANWSLFERPEDTANVAFTAPSSPPPGLCTKTYTAILVGPQPENSDLEPIGERATVVLDATVTWPPSECFRMPPTIFNDFGYIDPSGTVTYTAPGVTTPQPYSGATVTLSEYSSTSDSFSAVPPGSDVMSPANRTNPQTSDALGQFGWDTLAGEYEVSATATGCTGATTPPFALPPPQDDLILQMSCSSALAQTATTTMLSSNESSVYQGSSATLKADVSGGGAGTVDFTDGSTDLGSAVVVSGVATLTTSDLSLGSNSITASYSGDATHHGSTSTPALTLKVNTPPAGTAPAFTLDSPPLSATVTQPYSYQFGASDVETYSLAAGAPSWLSIDPLLGVVQGTPPAGTTSFTYSVTATNSIGPTTVGPFTVTVSTIPTFTALLSSANPSTYGQAVTFTATVSGTDGDGSVSFYADNSTSPITGCGGVALSLVSGNYQATCTTSSLAAGAHSISATYSGDIVSSKSSANLSPDQQVNPLKQFYWLAAGDGTVYSCTGTCTQVPSPPLTGSPSHPHQSVPTVGIASTPDGGGYWLVSANGVVSPFGDATNFCKNSSCASLPNPPPPGPAGQIVGIAADPSGGYWLVSQNGTVYALSGATSYGSLGPPTPPGPPTGGKPPAPPGPPPLPTVGIASTPDGGGYWLVSANGVVSPFGDAKPRGSLSAGARNLDQLRARPEQIVSISS